MLKATIVPGTNVLVDVDKMTEDEIANLFHKEKAMYALNGKELKVGDEINIPCIITALAGQNTMNVTLKHPIDKENEGGVYNVLGVNCKQVLKAE